MINIIVYLIVFILFIWEKIYYISRKEGNNTKKYFSFTRYNKCIIHNSYKCGCVLEEKENDYTFIIEKFILFYSYCTTPFEIKNGKIKILSIKDVLKVFEI